MNEDFVRINQDVDVLQAHVVKLNAYVDRINALKRGGIDIGRPGIYGNPVAFGTTRDTAVSVLVEKYREWLEGTKYIDVEPDRRKKILESILKGELDGKALVCYAHGGGMCHGDVLADFVKDKSLALTALKLSNQNKLIKASDGLTAEVLGNVEARLDQLRGIVYRGEEGVEDDYKKLEKEYEYLERKLEEKQKRQRVQQDRFMEIRPLVHRLVEAQVYSNYGHNPGKVLEEIINEKLLSENELQNLIKEVQDIKNFDQEIELIAKTRDKGKQNALDIQIAEMVFNIREKMFMIDAQAVVKAIYERPQEIETPQLKTSSLKLR